MTERLFDIVLKTPLGQRHGQLTLQAQGGTVSGRLTVLRGSEPIRGRMFPDGTLEFEGVMHSPVREHPYHAIGRLTGEALEMDLLDGRQCFRLKGSEVHE